MEQIIKHYGNAVLSAIVIVAIGVLVMNFLGSDGLVASTLDGYMNGLKSSYTTYSGSIGNSTTNSNSNSNNTNTESGNTNGK